MTVCKFCLKEIRHKRTHEQWRDYLPSIAEWSLVEDFPIKDLCTGRGYKDDAINTYVETKLLIHEPLDPLLQWTWEMVNNAN